MANEKISQLTDGSPAQAADQLLVNRGGTSYRVNAATIGDPTVFYAVDYGVVDDARFNSDGTISIGSALLTSPTGNFSSADNGKLVIVVNAVTGAYPFGTGLVTQVSCQSSTQITLSTTSNANISGTAMWAVGTDNGAAFNAAATAAWTVGKTLSLPPGVFIVASPPFVTSVTCTIKETADLCGATGTTNTLFILHPQISAGVTGNSQPIFYKSPTFTGWGPTGNADIMINNLRLTSLFGNIPIVGGYTMFIFGGAGSSLRMRGIQVQALNASTGTSCYIVNQSGGEGYFDLMNFQNTNCHGIGIGGQGCNNISNSVLAYFTVGSPIVIGTSAIVNLINDYITTNASLILGIHSIVNVFGGNYQNTGWDCTATDVILNAYGAHFLGNYGGGNNITTTGAVVKALGCHFVHTGSPTGYNIAGSGSFWDLGGNTFSATTSAINGPTVYGEASATGTLLTAGALALSAGWGTSAAITAVAGANAPIQFTITNGTVSTGASPTVTYTFPKPYLVAPLWITATQVGGTNPQGTFVVSSITNTDCVLTYSLTPTANDTEIVQLQVFTQ